MRRDVGGAGDPGGVEMAQERAGTRTRVVWIPFGVGAGAWGFPGRVPAGPAGGRQGGQGLQQDLEGALLVGLVGDIRQVDPAKVGSVVQDHVTHLEGEDVALEVLLQVGKEPARYPHESPETCEQPADPRHTLTL